MTLAKIAREIKYWEEINLNLKFLARKLKKAYPRKTHGHGFQKGRQEFMNSTWPSLVKVLEESHN